MNEDEPDTHPGVGLVRVRLDLSYDGGDFAGWALQPGQRTVLGELSQALDVLVPRGTGRFRCPVRRTLAPLCLPDQ